MLVICNPITEEPVLLRINAQGEGGEATLAVISSQNHTPRSRRGQLPPRCSPSTSSLHRRSVDLPEARRAATEADVRRLDAGVAGEMLARVMGADLSCCANGAPGRPALGGGAEAGSPARTAPICASASRTVRRSSTPER
jgi:hypothetical protein